MNIGENAPDFTLKDGEGNNWRLIGKSRQGYGFAFLSGR